MDKHLRGMLPEPERIDVLTRLMLYSTVQVALSLLFTANIMDPQITLFVCNLTTPYKAPWMDCMVGRPLNCVVPV